MATIEKRPLPPPNSTATRITEADRAEIIARANDVIDYYLNGPGSYFDAGPRKPLQETINDLHNFKDQVIASKQFADDPNSIMQSVVDLIGRTVGQVEEAARNNEGRDRISRPPPNTDDPIDDPRVISPRALSNAALPISLPVEGKQPPPQAGGAPGISSGKPVRILSRRVADEPPVAAFETGALAVRDRQDASSDRFGNRTSFPEGVAPHNPNLLAQAPQAGRPLGIFTGKPMPDYSLPPSVWGLSDNSTASTDGNWFTRPGGIAFRHLPPVPSPQTGRTPGIVNGNRVPRLSQVNGSNSPASVSDT